MDCSDSVLSFTSEDYENKAIDSSRAGKVDLGSDDGLWVVSVGDSEGCSVGGSDEGSVGDSDGGFV